MTEMHQDMNIKLDASVNKSKRINISKEEQVQIFAKQMLSRRLFVGHYQERRYVETLNSYRDIVRVFDDDLPRDLNIVRKRIQEIYPAHIIWIGITGPDMIGAPVGCCLWVKLSNVPFGHYWFQIREVKFEENKEIFIRLKCIRPISHLEQQLPGGVKSEKEISGKSELAVDETPAAGGLSDEVVPAFDIEDLLSYFKNIQYKAIISNSVFGFFSLLTKKNLKECISLLVILIISAVTGLFKCVTYLGDFSLKAMREITLFVQVCTPIFLGIIDFISKCFGGILILISLMWRGTPPPNAFQQNLNQQQVPRVAPLAITDRNYKLPPPIRRRDVNVLPRQYYY